MVVCCQVAARKRSRRHLTETDEYTTNNSEGILSDPLTITTAYQKMKSLCLNIRNEIRTDIEIHNQHILPRYTSNHLVNTSKLDFSVCHKNKPSGFDAFITFSTGGVF